MSTEKTPVSPQERRPGSAGRKMPGSHSNRTSPVFAKERCPGTPGVDIELQPTVSKPATVMKLLRTSHAEAPVELQPTSASVKERPQSAAQARTVRPSGVTGRLPRPQSAMLSTRPRSAPRYHPRQLLFLCSDEHNYRPTMTFKKASWRSDSDLAKGTEVAVVSQQTAELTADSLRPPMDAMPRVRRAVEKPCSPAVLVDVKGSIVEVRSRILDAALKQPALTGTTRWRLEMARMIELEQQSRLAPLLMCKSTPLLNKYEPQTIIPKLKIPA